LTGCVPRLVKPGRRVCQQLPVVAIRADEVHESGRGVVRRRQDAKVVGDTCRRERQVRPRRSRWPRRRASPAYPPQRHTPPPVHRPPVTPTAAPRTQRPTDSAPEARTGSIAVPHRRASRPRAPGPRWRRQERSSHNQRQACG
jgi:hypothetical protein